MKRLSYEAPGSFDNLADRPDHWRISGALGSLALLEISGDATAREPGPAELRVLQQGLLRGPGQLQPSMTGRGICVLGAESAPPAYLLGSLKGYMTSPKYQLIFEDPFVSGRFWRFRVG